MLQHGWSVCSLISPALLWVPETKLRSSGLVKKWLYTWSHLASPQIIFTKCFVTILVLKLTCFLFMLKDKSSFQNTAPLFLGTATRSICSWTRVFFSGTEVKLSLNSRIIESVFLLGECSCPHARVSLRSCSLFELLFNAGVLERWSRSAVWKPRSLEGPVRRWLGPGTLLNKKKMLWTAEQPLETVCLHV